MDRIDATNVGTSMHRIALLLVCLALCSTASAQVAPLPLDLCRSGPDAMASARLAGHSCRDLQTVRATHGAPWGPDQRAAIDAMGRIFEHTAWIGMTFSQVRALLGPEDRAETNRGVPCLVYARHDGEQGDVRRLCGPNGRVDDVERLPTQ